MWRTRHVQVSKVHQALEHGAGQAREQVPIQIPSSPEVQKRYSDDLSEPIRS